MWAISEESGQGRRSISAEDFRDRFLEICGAHRAQGRALGFAFILFSAKNPHIIGALQDHHYWEALDKITGRHLSVFSFVTRHGASQYGNDPRPVLRSMFQVPAVTSAQPLARLSDYFPGMNEGHLPCILFFQVSGGSVIDSFAVSLSDTSADPPATFNELAGILTVAADSVSHVTDDNAINGPEIFGLIRGAVADWQVKQRLATIFQGIRVVAPAIGVARWLISLI